MRFYVKELGPERYGVFDSDHHDLNYDGEDTLAVVIYFYDQRTAEIVCDYMNETWMRYQKEER